MTKPTYSDYVRFSMRFYARYTNKQSFKSDVDRANWEACRKVIKPYPDRDKDILLYVYGAFDTIADNVYAMANKYHIHQNVIWDMMKEFERKVAIERGLWV